MQRLPCESHTHVEQAVYIIGVSCIVFSELWTEVRHQQDIVRLAALRSVDRGQLDRRLVRELSAAF